MCDINAQEKNITAECVSKMEENKKMIDGVVSSGDSQESDICLEIIILSMLLSEIQDAKKKLK